MNNTPRRPPIALATLEDARALERRVRASAAAAAGTLADLLASGEPLEAFRAMKFRRVGSDPLDPSRPANVIEQIHQTFPYLTSIRAVEYLLRHHPRHAPFLLSFGANPGPDVVSHDGEVAAETVAVITAKNNNKFAFDLQRMRDSTATHRYLFYYAEEDAGTLEDPEVTIVPVTL